MNKLFRLMIATLVVFGLISTAVLAQDDEDGEEVVTDVDMITYVDPDPVAVNDVTSDETIEAITDNSDDFYGAIVTIEGTLSNFVGTRLFEVAEDELLTDSIVLVANNSNQPFPETLVEGALVRVTGRVHPSFDVVQEDEYVYAPFDSEASQEGMERMNIIDFIHRGYVPEEFGEHTIVEVLNVENVELLGYDDLLTID